MLVAESHILIVIATFKFVALVFTISLFSNDDKMMKKDLIKLLFEKKYIFIAISTSAKMILSVVDMRFSLSLHPGSCNQSPAKALMLHLHPF